LRINKDVTKTLIVKADAKATTTQGYVASVTLDFDDGITAQDSITFDAVAETGSDVLGTTQYLYTRAPSLALVSQSITPESTTQGSLTQAYTGKIKINVTANGADILVPLTGTANSSGLVASPTGAVGAPTLTFTSNATLGTNAWRVSSGETKWFELSGIVAANQSVCAGGWSRLYLTSFKWDISDNAAGTADNDWTWGLTDLKTSDIYLNPMR
jgi:hypothetical protein